MFVGVVHAPVATPEMASTLCLIYSATLQKRDFDFRDGFLGLPLLLIYIALVTDSNPVPLSLKNPVF